MTCPTSEIWWKMKVFWGSCRVHSLVTSREPETTLFLHGKIVTHQYERKIKAVIMALVARQWITFSCQLASGKFIWIILNQYYSNFYPKIPHFVLPLTHQLDLWMHFVLVYSCVKWHTAIHLAAHSSCWAVCTPPLHFCFETSISNTFDYQMNPLITAVHTAKADRHN